MNVRHLLAAALIAPLALLAGCTDTEAEKTVENVTGVDEGSETSTTGVEKKGYTVEMRKTVTDNETGEVVSKEIDRTDVTVTKEQKQSTDIEVDAGETTTETTGTPPEGLDDN